MLLRISLFLFQTAVGSLHSCPADSLTNQNGRSLLVALLVCQQPISIPRSFCDHRSMLHHVVWSDSLEILSSSTSHPECQGWLGDPPYPYTVLGLAAMSQLCLYQSCNMSCAGLLSIHYRTVVLCLLKIIQKITKIIATQQINREICLGHQRMYL